MAGQTKSPSRRLTADEIPGARLSPTTSPAGSPRKVNVVEGDDELGVDCDEAGPIRIYGSTSESAPLHAKAKERYRDENTEISVPTHSALHTSDSWTGDQAESLLEGRPRTFSEASQSYTDTVSVMSKTFGRHWWKHPKVKENKKTVLASLLLLFAGIVLGITGLAIELSRTTTVKSFIFFIASAICLIPGTYHVIYIYCAVKGRYGFSFQHIPVFK